MQKGAQDWELLVCEGAYSFRESMFTCLFAHRHHQNWVHLFQASSHWHFNREPHPHPPTISKGSKSVAATAFFTSLLVRSQPGPTAAAPRPARRQRRPSFTSQPTTIPHSVPSMATLLHQTRATKEGEYYGWWGVGGFGGAKGWRTAVRQLDWGNIIARQYCLSVVST